MHISRFQLYYIMLIYYIIIIILITCLLLLLLPAYFYFFWFAILKLFCKFKTFLSPPRGIGPSSKQYTYIYIYILFENYR